MPRTSDSHPGTFDADAIGPFGRSDEPFRFDQFRPEQVEAALDVVLADGRRLLIDVENLQASPDAITWDSVIGPVERFNDDLRRVWGTTAHLMSVANSAELREVYARLQPRIVELSLELQQSRAMFSCLERLAEDPSCRSGVKQRILEAMLRQARLSGVGLEGKARDRFAAIEQELAELGTRFSNNLLDATAAFSLDIEDLETVESMPSQVRAQAAQAWAAGQGDDASAQANPEQGPWRFTLDAPSLMGFLEHCPRRDLREVMYRAQATRASSGEHDNTTVVEQILGLRREAALLLGYSSHAEVSLADKMARSVDEVTDLLTQLREASAAAALAEHEELLAFARRSVADGEAVPELALWDIPYWSERLREHSYGLRDEELRPYFPLPRVLQGLFALVERLFGVEVVEATADVEVWHPDVRYFQVLTGGEAVAGFYLDAYARSGTKRGGAWMNSAISRSLRMAAPGSEARLPVAYVVCNQSAPTQGSDPQPSLMSFGEVRTLFHEFGHALQHMLTTVDESLAAGIDGVEWDAVEIASQFMENWCYEPATLRSCSAHIETGKPVPDDLLAKLLRARNFRAATAMIRQLGLSMIDLELHHQYHAGTGETAFDLQRRIVEEFGVLAPLPEDRFLCGFTHIFAGGYAAGYYSYKWAEVMSADVFEAFEEVGVENQEAVAAKGCEYRDTFLALGGGVEPNEVFRRFRGRGPRVQALLRHSGLAA